MSIVLRAINKVIQPMGSLQPEISLPFILPRGWSIIMIDFFKKKTDFLLSLYENSIKKKVAFTMPTSNNSQD